MCKEVIFEVFLAEWFARRVSDKKRTTLEEVTRIFPTGKK